VIGEMYFVEKGHEVIEGHGLEMFTLEFNPINKMDILDAVKSMFDNLVSGDVLIVGEPPPGPLPVYTGLRSWVTGTQIGRFGVGLLFDNGKGSRIEF